MNVTQLDSWRDIELKLYQNDIIFNLPIHSSFNRRFVLHITNQQHSTKLSTFFLIVLFSNHFDEKRLAIIFKEKENLRYITT